MVCGNFYWINTRLLRGNNSDTTDSPFKGREDREMQSYMEQMDAELARTSIADSFEKRPAPADDRMSQENLSQAEPQGESEEELPVDVDFNLVRNILQSFSTQQGLAGPASNILNSMGVWLPPNKDVI
ncbi:protein ecdysoneless homolog [Montipora foliosa]|uniref:protein ecdysoneless homolog n=1 Tax=Montipora foliosa TaxID=591990 RepID=UPI0035F15CDC